MGSRIHFHSDCNFFSGSENMLVNFLSSPQLRERYEVSLSYRSSAAYIEGLHKRISVDFPVYALKLPGPVYVNDDTSHWLRKCKRTIYFLSRLLFNLPVFLFDVVILSRLFRQIRPQIIHINNGGYPAALSCRAATVAARLCGIGSVVMVVNNQAVPYTDLRRWLDYPVDRWVVKSVSKFVTGSLAAAVQLQKVLKLFPEQVTSLHNGILLRSLTDSPEETRKRLGVDAFDGLIFGIVAIIERWKGHHVLIEAIGDVVTKNPDINIKLLIEGEGSARRELEEMVVEKGLDTFVRFVGKEENIIDFMSILDVVVLPSTCYEDFPNVILEAMALGKPVIASRLAGTPEQVEDGVTGILVAPGDVEALAESLITLIRNPVLIEQYGECGRVRFQENFRAEVAVERYLRLYQDITGGEC